MFLDLYVLNLLIYSSYDMYNDVEGKLGLVPDTEGLPHMVNGDESNKELPDQLVRSC